MTNWDNEIDIVARAMTEGEPDGALKARVLARLDRPPARRRLWIFAPVAIAAVGLMGVLLVRGQAPTIDAVRQPDRTVARRTPDAETSTPPPLESVGRDVRASSGRPPAGTTFDAVKPNDSSESLAPLPLEVESLDVESMDAMET